MPNAGRSLELFYIDGIPDGLLTAEIFNWTGHVLMAPRTRLIEALKRKEATYTGVYILIGESDTNLPKVYIGESEDVAERIRNHDAKKDWWTQAVLITSAANQLNKAHVKYLESRLVEEAKRAGRMNLENANTPPRPGLSEAAQANMEQFVDYVLSILPALRVDSFLVKTRSTPQIAHSIKHADPVFVLRSGTAKAATQATAVLRDGEFIVQPGSFGPAEWVGVKSSYRKLFDEIVKSGAYVQEGERRIFKDAYAFSSTSAAGAILKGQSVNGPTSWRLKSDPNITYKQWEADQLNSA